jgi:threonine synthase
MIYTDTRDNNIKVDLKTAVMGGMNEKTGGLYIPVEFPKLDSSLLNKDPSPSFRDIAFNMAKPYVEGEIPDDVLAEIIQDAYPFSPKVVPLDSISYCF